MDDSLPDHTEVFEYLDELRESGSTNMFGAGPYVAREFGLSDVQARKFCTAWLNTFSDEPAHVRASKVPA